MSWAQTAPPAALRAVEPLRRGATRARDIRTATAGSALVHAGIAAVALFGGADRRNRAPDPVQPPVVEIRSRPAPEVARAEATARPLQRPDVAAPLRRKVAARPLEPAPAPRVSPRSAPVVGISFEATVEGEGGPAFAVGDSRAGETAPRAAEKAPPAASDRPNKVASYLPHAGASFTPPRRKSPSRAPYPETLKAQGVEADVTVSVSLAATGRVERVVIVAPAPFDEMNEAARRAARAEEFEPATRDGVPIPYTVSFTFRFRLEEQ
jgi:TonB family protein